MQKPEFVYTTYINTTLEQLWRGLTDPSFTRRYWGLSFETDWQAGSTLTFDLANKCVRIADPAQRILESDPYRSLSYTWHSFTEEWAQASEVSQQRLAELQSESRSKVSFDLEELGPMVKLTVVHDGSAVLQNITQGWPAVLSSLKTLLETGEALPAP